MLNARKLIFVLVMIFGSAVALTGCDQGPAEQAGENVDNAVENAADNAENAVENAGDAVENAGDAVKDATN
jgi:hypothetical protein